VRQGKTSDSFSNVCSVMSKQNDQVEKRSLGASIGAAAVAGTTGGVANAVAVQTLKKLVGNKKPKK
jgi:hypothetical protein